MMLELKTQRLKIIPLDMDNLVLLVQNYGRMEKNLGVTASGNEPEPHLREALKKSLEHALGDRANHIWYTHWQFVLKGENRIIGSACFKYPPGENGEVEVGYGMEPGYEGQGYMTEALGEMLKWAFRQPGVLHVIAETEKENTGSQRVLTKLGFQKYRETKECFWWRV